MKNFQHLKVLKAALVLAVMQSLGGCEQWVMSDRQKVVKAAHEAICSEKDLEAIKPFVSKSSLPLLELTSAITNFGQVLIGSALSDRIAVECHSGQQRFVDEIKVSERRFIVRTKNPGSEEIIETVVLLEEGNWKIALLGR